MLSLFPVKVGAGLRLSVYIFQVSSRQSRFKEEYGRLDSTDLTMKLSCCHTFLVITQNI